MRYNCEYLIHEIGTIQFFFTQDQLGAYTRLDLEMENNKETSVLELKLKALIFDTIYHISVVNDLINDGVDDVDEWSWQKRIRYLV